MGDVHRDDLFEKVKSIETAKVFQAFYPKLKLKPDGANRQKTNCPFHEGDNDPSLKIYPTHFKCYGCGIHGSNIDLVLKADPSLSPLEAAQAIAKEFGIPLKDTRPPRKQISLSQYGAYLGIPEEYLIEEFHLKEGEKGIEIPYDDENGNLEGVLWRHILEKANKSDFRFSWKEGKPYLYGSWAILQWKESGLERVVLVEGPSDVQVCWYNDIPALGVPGASTFKKDWVQSLLKVPELDIIQEPDRAGEGFGKLILSTLKEANYQGRVRAFTLPEKDARDLWLKCGGDKETFTEKLQAAIEKAPLISSVPTFVHV